MAESKGSRYDKKGHLVYSTGGSSGGSRYGALKTSAEEHLVYSTGDSVYSTGGQRSGLKILVVDGHPIMRAGLRALLEAAGMDVIGEARNCDEGVRLIQELAPDLVVLDSEVDGFDGIEVIGQMIAQRPAAKVLILAKEDDPHLMRDVIQAGASGYLLKRAAQDELVYAIEVVMGGNLYVHPLLMRTLFVEAGPIVGIERQPAGDGQLTERETEVLQLVSQGFTNAQIAEVLKISVRTVEFHRSNLMSKLNARSRADLVRFAAENGYLREER